MISKGKIMSEEKKEKTTSKSLDLDFSNISGERRSRTTAKPDKPKDVVTGATDELKGIILSIPSDDKSGWIMKDITEFSAEEFEIWAARVFPAPLSVFGLEDTKQLNEIRCKMGIFKSILRYHIRSPFFMGTEPKEKSLPN
jgi:hypothetical protein